MSLIEIDHVEVGLSRVIDKLDKENFNKSLEIYLTESQEIERAFLKLAEQKSIDLAEGVWLDYIGKIVGLPRGGRNDIEYRIALKLKIAINRADGTPNIMIDLVQQFTNSQSVELREGTIAWGTIRFNGQDNTGASSWELVDQIKPAGTWWTLHSDYNNNALRLAWEIQAKVSEPFDVTDEGTIYEGFEVTNTGDVYEPFYYQDTSTEYYEGSDGTQSFFAWELLTPLQVTEDGFNFEDFLVTQEVGGDEEIFYVYGEDNTLDKDLPLPWEVTEESLPIS